MRNERLTRVRHDTTGHHLARGPSQQCGHVIQHALHHQEGLGHAKAPEGGVGGQVGPADGAAAAQVGDIVGVVHLEYHLIPHLEEEEEEENQHLLSSQRAEGAKAVTNQVGFVEGVSSVDIVLKICSHDAAVVHETHLGGNVKHHLQGRLRAHETISVTDLGKCF